MKIDEFPQLLRTLAATTGSFDPVLIMYDKVLQTGYLHFGFWPVEQAKEADLQVVMGSARAAQLRFADEVLACVPPGTHRVLDVGAGLGKLSGELAQRGHTVTAITPDVHQAQRITAQYPRVTVLNGFFQDVAKVLAPASFDVIIFSESFRYMPLTQVFGLLGRLLSPNGRVVIADWFARETMKARPGHDHNLAAFRDATTTGGFTVVTDRDVTANILPTVKLGYDILCEFYLPLAGFVLAKFAQKRPRLFRWALGWILRWMERRVLPQVPRGRFDPQVFAAHYRYSFFVLRRTGTA